MIKHLVAISLLVLPVLSQPTAASASTLLEPYLGYTFGSVEQKNPSGTFGGSINGMQAGARVGSGVFGILTVGLDYRVRLTGTQTIDEGVPSPVKSDISGSALGLFAAASFPGVPLTVRAGYTFLGGATAKPVSTTGDTELSSASGMTLGAGWKLLPILAVNLDVSFSRFGHLKNATVDTDVPSAGIEKPNETTYLLSASVPLEF